MVEARFICSHKGDLIKNDNTGAEGRNVLLNADVEDPVFGVFTPSGQISMQIVGAAADRFEVGKKYRVYFDEIIETENAPEASEPATFPGNEEPHQES